MLSKTSTVVSSILILDKGEICTDSYALLGVSDSEEEIDKIYKYVRSKFFRFLVSLRIDNMCGVGKDRFKFVPMLDGEDSQLKEGQLEEGGQLDWGVSLSDIDKQLYKKYSLTDKEIDYIEKRIGSYNRV